jgi:hypothetical protein
MPVRKSAGQSPEMQAFYERTRTSASRLSNWRLPAAGPGSPLHPAGDSIIGKGLEEITVNQAEVQPTFEQLKSTLDEEAAPILEQGGSARGLGARRNANDQDATKPRFSGASFFSQFRCVSG